MPFSIIDQEILDQEKSLRELHRVLRNPVRRLHDLDELLRDRDQRIRDSWLRSIALCLQLKFKKEGHDLFSEVQKQTDVEWLGRFFDRIDSADSLDDLRKLIP